MLLWSLKVYLPEVLMAKDKSAFLKVMVPYKRKDVDDPISYVEIEEDQKPTLGNLITLTSQIWPDLKPSEEVEISVAQEFVGIRLTRIST